MITTSFCSSGDDHAVLHLSDQDVCACVLVIKLTGCSIMKLVSPYLISEGLSITLFSTKDETSQWS